MDRWRAAVALQHDVAAQLETLEGQAYADAVNGARDELHAAWNALENAAARTELCDEWHAAYCVVRDAELRACARLQRRAVLQAVEAQRLGACAVAARIAEALAR